MDPLLGAPASVAVRLLVLRDAAWGAQPASAEARRVASDKAYSSPKIREAAWYWHRDPDKGKRTAPARL